MKSYSQFSESLNDLYLKEWEKLDEDNQKEIIRQYAEENNIELDEEAATLALTSPFWVPLAKAALGTGLTMATGWAANRHIKNYQQNKEAEKFLNQSSNIPKSNRTDKQREETANREKERINTGNKDSKEEIRNQKESQKINKQLQNRNENPNNPNKKPGFGKRFKNFIKDNPLKSLAAGTGLTWATGVGLDKAARNSGVIPDNRANIKNNNNNNNNNNSNSNTYDPTLDPKNKNKFK